MGEPPQPIPPPVPGSGASNYVPPDQTTVRGGAADIVRPGASSAGSVIGATAGCLGLILLVVVIGGLMFLNELMKTLSCSDCAGSYGVVTVSDLGLIPVGFMLIPKSLRAVLRRG